MAVSSNPLIDALLRSDLQAAAALLEQGVDINLSIGDSRWTPLHYAAEHQLAEEAKWLLDHGANPDARDFAGQTPMFVAIDSDADSAEDVFIRTGVRTYCLDTLRILLGSGGNPNSKRNDGMTLLELAMKRKHSEAVEILAGFGAQNLP